MAHPLSSLLNLNIGSPYGRQNQQLPKNVPVAPWQNNSQQQQQQQLPWQNNAQSVNFPVPPTNNSNGILGCTPILPPPKNSNPILPPPMNRPAGGNTTQVRPPWQQSQSNQKPPGLLDGIGGVPQSGMQPLIPGLGSQNTNNNSNRFQGNNMNVQNNSNTPQRNNNLGTFDLEKRALETGVSKEFYERIRPINIPKIVENVALDFARIEYLKKRGLGAPNPNPTGIGHHMCPLCNIRYLTGDQLNQHNMTPNHIELESIHNLKKEQARLIKENKIKHPDDKNKPPQPTQPDATMIAISRAEVEMKLEPARMELDPYILGIYESIMRPYWPVPKSTYYCRICNYIEFKGQSELDRHNQSTGHKKRENTYAEAFCLFCQVHNVDSSIMKNHEKTVSHKKAKDLMRSTKRSAITHWHKVNRTPLPIKYTEEWAEEDRAKDNEIVGAKRSASGFPDQTSPAKKVANSMANSAPHKAGQNFGSQPKNGQNTGPPPRSGQHAGSQPKYGQNADNKKPDTTIDLTKPSPKDKNKGKSPNLINHALSDKNKMWFAPITGYMCVACHIFIPSVSEQSEHLKQALHGINVAKFKKMLQN